jgi:hypothetical protein
MGGIGSGRRWHLNKADTVEDCRVLDLGALGRKGPFVPGYTGEVRWSWGGLQTGSISFAVEPGPAGGLILRLSYLMTQTGEEVSTPIRLETTRPHFGGARWWGRCPLAVGGRACGRRVRKLYLPPGGRYFGCRVCYGLTYPSCQDSHKGDRFCRHLAQKWGRDFAAVKRAFDRIGKGI